MTAGNALAYTELFARVRRELHPLRDPSICEIVECIKDCYTDLRHKIIRERVLKPSGLESLDHFHKIQHQLHAEFVFGVQGKIDRLDYGLEIIVTGGGHRAHIYGIFNPGTSYCFDAIGFHSIGIGSRHALNGLIGRECYCQRPATEVVIIVYEAKRLAQKAPGVGLVTDMVVMTPKGVIAIPRKEIDTLEPIYQKWRREDEGWERDMQDLWGKWTSIKQENGGERGVA
jgi:hypothetical protein